MRNIKGVIISDKVEQAIYEATELYGVYEFDIDYKLGNIIYVLGISDTSLSKMIAAQDFLNQKCPEFTWVAALTSWDCIMSGEILFTSSVWFDEEVGRHGKAN